jgi:outer membrane protein assembly factor BamB
MLPTKSITAILLTLSFLTIPCIARTQDWPQWRGPSRDGALKNFKTPSVWPDQLKLLWKIPVGGGISSPVVSGEKAWIHTRKGEDEIVSCIDLKTGKVLWTKSYSAPFAPNTAAAKLGKGPFSTPLLHEGKLYTLGVTAILSCFDSHSGELKCKGVLVK